MLFARFGSIALLCLSIASSASAVTIDWVPVGNPGNAGDPQTCLDCPATLGSVAAPFQISKYEVTNAQYAEFLNAVAQTDTNGLYDPSMGDVGQAGGIARSGSAGSYSYSPISGRGDKPVQFVSFYDALRFANWLNNGQPTGAQGPGTTESGAYTITAQGILDNSIARNPGALVFLPSENEWYKAAFYDAPSASYFDYPAGSNAQTTCAAPSAAANQGNCANAVGDLTDVGSYTGSASPYGTFDQGGNVMEWVEQVLGTGRIQRGGGYLFPADFLSGGGRIASEPGVDIEGAYLGTGFRVASLVPEPGTFALVLLGLGGLGLRGRRR